MTRQDLWYKMAKTHVLAKNSWIATKEDKQFLKYADLSWADDVKSDWAADDGSVRWVAMYSMSDA